MIFLDNSACENDLQSSKLRKIVKQISSLKNDFTFNY